MAENEKDQETTEQTEAEVAAPEAAQAPADQPEGDKVAYTLKETKDEEGSIKRHVVEVAREVLDAKLQDVLAELRKTVTIDGFRRGKAPVGLLKIRFGKEAQQDALAEIAGNVGLQIIEASDLEAIADPVLAESSVEVDKPVTLEIDIEVQPKIDVQGHTGNEYEVEVRDVTDAIVDEQLDSIRQANVTFEETEADKTYEEGDGVTVDMVVTDGEGKRLESLCRENVFLREPKSALLPEVFEALKGKKAGDEFEQVVERTVKNREGEDVTHSDTYAIVVRDVKTRNVPELDDEFAKDVGDFETLDALRARIRSDLEEQRDRTKRQQAMEKIMKDLQEKNEFDAPKTLVAQQEYQMIMRDTQQMQQMGIDLSAMGLTPDSYLANARQNAANLVKANMLINAIAQQEKIETNDEDVDKEIERRAEAEGRKALAIRARLEAEKQLDGLKRQLLVDKVEDFLMEKNTINVVEPKEEKPEEKE